MRRFATRWSVAPVIFCIVGLGSLGEAVSEDRVSKASGPILVENPAMVHVEPEPVTPRELWRLGGESEEDEQIFGDVEELLLDEAGNVYILDSQLNEIRVFSPDAQYLRTVGRAGEAPGEFRNPMSFVLLPEDRICVMQAMPSRMVTMTRLGDALPDLPLPLEASYSTTLYREMRTHGDRIFASYLAPVRSADKTVAYRGLLEMALDGTLIRSFKEHVQEHDPGPLSIGAGIEENFYSDWQVGPKGRIFAAPRDERYEIHAIDPGGGPDLIVSVEYEPLQRSAEMLSRLRADAREFESTYGFPPVDGEPGPFEPNIIDFYVRPDGEIWVRTSRGLAATTSGSLGRFDVLGPAGRFIRRTTLSVDYDDTYDDYRIVGDRLFILKEIKATNDRVSESGAGGSSSTMIRRNGRGLPEEAREARPFEIICYELPLAGTGS